MAKVNFKFDCGDAVVAGYGGRKGVINGCGILLGEKQPCYWVLSDDQSVNDWFLEDMLCLERPKLKVVECEKSETKTK